MPSYCVVIWLNGSTLKVSKPFANLSIPVGWTASADIDKVVDVINRISNEGWVLKKSSFQRDEHTYLFEK